MDTANGTLQGTRQTTTGKPLDSRIVLAVLWVAGMLSSLNGDTFRLSAMTQPLGVDAQQLSIFSVVLLVQILMSVLTLTLKSPVSRWANRIIGIFHTVFVLVFPVLHIFVWHSDVYEIVWSTAQLVFALLVVWYAWKWTEPEGKARRAVPVPVIQ